MRGESRASGDETDAGGDEGDAQPTQGADMFMQEKPCDQLQEYVSERSRRKDVGEISPGERGGIRSEKGQQQENADGDPGIENGQKYAREIMQRDIAHLLHAMGQQGISHCCEEGHSAED